MLLCSVVDTVTLTLVSLINGEFGLPQNSGSSSSKVPDHVTDILTNDEFAVLGAQSVWQ